MIELRLQGDGVLLPVQVQPKARKTGVVGIHNGRLKVAVTDPPDKGKANDAVIRVLAEFFGIRRSQIELLTGATNTLKAFRINGLTATEIEARIAAGSG